MARFIFKSTQTHQSLILFCLVAVIAVTLSNLFWTDAELGSFKYTHYLFNYQEEFIKRGLVGEVFRQLGFQMSYDLATLFAVGLFAFLTSVLFVVFVWPFRTDLNQAGTWLFWVFALTHSATIQNLYLDFGRYDGLGLLLTLLSMAIIAKSRVVSYGLIPLIFTLAILIHEASFIIYLPMVIAFWLYQAQGRKQIIVVMLVTLLMATVTYTVSKLGLATHTSLEQHHQALVAEQGAENVNVHSVAVVHERGLKENIELTVQYGLTPQRIQNHLGLVLILFPTFWLIYVLFAAEVKQSGLSFRLLFLASAFSPLLLYPLGLDHFRWWALAITNFLMVIAGLSYLDKHYRQRVIDIFYRQQWMVLAAVVISCVTGGLGVMAEFARLE